MDNIDVSLPLTGQGSEKESREGPEKHHVEPDRDGIYLDYGPPLPDSYHQDIIVALIRDPECIFCYWELSGEVARKVAADFSLRNLKWILRVHTLRCETQESSPVRDNLPASPPCLGCPEGQRGKSQKLFNDIVLPTPQNYSSIQGNYYLTVLPDTKYQLEFGVLTADNRFISLVKSNTVTTPRRNKAPMTDITSYIR